MEKVSLDEINIAFTEMLEKNEEHTVRNFLDLLHTFESMNAVGGKKANQKFHHYNRMIVDYARINITNSIYATDSVIYILAFLMYRFQLNPYHSNFNTKCREWFDKIGEPSLDMNLFTFFLGKQIGNTQQTVFNIINNVRDQRNIREAYLLTRALLYDESFLTSEILYKNEKHTGLYFLYDMLCNEFAKFMDQEQLQKWKLLFKDYWLNRDNIKPFYRALSVLQYALSFSTNEPETAKELLAQVSLLPLDNLNDTMTIGDSILLYSMKMLVLGNLGEFKDIFTTCDNILNWLKNTDYNNRWFYEYVCRTKFEAIDKLDDVNKNELYCDLVKGTDINDIGNLVFLMPQLSNSLDDEIIYHYSDITALKSIVDNKQLWLTRYDYLNDTEEVKFTYLILKNYIEQISKDTIDEFNGYLKECIKLLQYYFNESPYTEDEIGKTQSQILTEIRKSIASIYVLSASTDDDNLSLWHYYSGGTGANIKFKAKALRKEIELSNNAIKQMTANVFMNRIGYLGLTDSNDIVEKLKLFYHNFSGLPFNHKLYFGCINILFEGIFKKNINMRQETEYRIALIVPNHKDEAPNPANAIKEKYRVKGNALVIPYMELAIEPTQLIEGIKIAPLNKSDITKRGLADFLRSKGYTNPEQLISLSDIRLRY